MLSNPIPNLRPSRRLLRIVIHIPKHGFRLSAYDETPMPVLDSGRHRTRICQFWAHAMDDHEAAPRRRRLSVFADGRGTEEIAGRLTDFSGILQVDGYAAYKALARGQGGAIQLAFVSPMPHANSSRSTDLQSPFAHT
ncbi:IS66 family transposase [Bradyrhizobium sp. CW4]|uniref:IS66 family transposase n=1 Tax=Bradyrhizobium sp. CW4 TaxID=2782687 RepID=UPI002111D9E7|nr:IS66 family transposase [Bradyrhizobium sp. CW4]